MHTVFFCIPEAWLCTSTNQSAFLHFRKHKKSFQPGRFKAKSILIFYSQNWYFTTKVMILWNWWKVIPYWKPIEEKATHSRLGNYDDSSSSRNLLRVFFSTVLRLVRQKSLLHNGLKLFSKCTHFHPPARDIHIECSKQFKRSLYFYMSGQSGPFWAVLKLL